MNSEKLQELRAYAARAGATATSTVNTLAQLASCKENQDADERAWIKTILPFDSGPQLLNIMEGEHGDRNRRIMSEFVLSITRGRDFATKGLTTCLTSRFIANHIWDEQQVR